MTQPYKEYIKSNLEDYLAYQQAAVDREPEMTKALRRLLAERLDIDKPLALLDIGCGNGNTMVHIGRQFPHWSFVGVDVVPELISQGKALFGHLPNLTLDVCDAHAVMERFEQQFDIVLIWRALLSFEDWRAALRAAHSLTRKGGALIFSTLVNEVDVDLSITSIAHQSLGQGRELPARVLAPSVIKAAVDDFGISAYRADRFEIGVDLPKDLNTNRTYTEALADGRRLQFAYGLLIDHWHIVHATV